MGAAANLDGAAVRAAAERTLATGTARLATFASSLGPMPGAGDFRGDGIADFGHRRTLFTTSLLTPNTLADKQRDFPQKRRTLALLKALSHPSDVFYDGAARYVCIDLAGMDASGIDVSDIAVANSGWKRPDADSSDGPRVSNDPTWKLCVLAGANDDVAPAAAATIRGVETTGVSMTLDLEAASARVPGGIKIERPRSWLRRRREGSTWWLRVPAFAWIDAEGLVRRVSTAHLARPAKTRELASWFGTEFWDFGGPRPLELPVLDSTDRGPLKD